MTPITSSPDPAHDQRQPAREHKECDLVMKGGITSGIVYPPLVLELEKNDYSFRNIGGTSAGAIAAAVTAAAECGRDTKAGGFPKLEEISKKLREEDFVKNLFQPTGGMRPLMETLLDKRVSNGVGGVPKGARLGALRRAVKFGKLLGKVVKEKNRKPYDNGATLGGALAAAAAGITAFLASAVFFLCGLLFVGWWPLFLTCLVGFALISVLLALCFCWLGAEVGGLAGGLHDLYQRLTVGTRNNFFGLCSGLKDRKEPSQGAVLTEWLHETIQNLSGRDKDGAPLTFGDLWKWPEPSEGEDVTRRRGRHIDLRMVTADLSQNQPYVLPFERDDLFIFKEKDLKRLFPQSVVEYMVAKGKERKCSGLELSDGAYFLPQAKDLPVIFATRMSLSFPVLISMVPLYTISGDAFGDMKVRLEVVSHPPEGEERERLMKAVEGRAPEVPDENRAAWELATGETIYLREEDADGNWVIPKVAHPVDAERHLQINWFSDGGICSNFPIHFFDAWLPTRPTFGVNLTSQMAGVPEQPAGEQAGGEVAERRKQAVRKHSSVSTVQCAPTSQAAPEKAPADDDKDVYLPRPDEVLRPEWIPIDDLVKVLKSVFTTAQNYRDNMQAALPSYRERIVQVRLSDKEGGLNLDMKKDVLEAVAEKGERAGVMLSTDFDKKSHQWVRFRVLMKQMESQLIEMNRIMVKDPFYQKIVNADEDFDTAGLPYVPSDFKPETPELEGWRLRILKRLLAIGGVIGTFESGDLFAREPQPMPEPVLRVTPRI